MIVTAGDLDHPQVRALLQLHLSGMHAASPPEHVHALDLSGLRQPNILFVTAWDGGNLLGCGALRELSPLHGEIKSMRTRPEHLRKGVGVAILDHLLVIARDRGYRAVSLETGTGASFQAAVALYTRFGFVQGAPFGDYQANAFSRFFHLTLDRS